MKRLAFPPLVTFFSSCSHKLCGLKKKQNHLPVAICSHCVYKYSDVR